MHDIQKHALKKLSLSKACTYSELKPKGIESNAFAYHLRSLIAEGLVAHKTSKAKNSAPYSLTAKGKQYVDTVSFESFKPRIQPKIVTLLVIEKKDSKARGGISYVMYKRNRSPFINHIGFPYGKIHLEERLYEAAERELQEKTGLSAKLSHKGDVYITVHDETELVSHMLCHVFVGSNPTGILKTDDTTGQCFWAHMENIPVKQLIPGVQQILKLLNESKKKNEKGRFFAEYFLNTSDD
jgi:ADP-ribose pyrophosphatase YjhB (NUDIX family)